MRKYFVTSLIIMLFLVSACSVVEKTNDTDNTISQKPVYDNNEQDPEDVIEVVKPSKIVFPLPVMDMGTDNAYLGESGGLYGNGINIPPEAHRQAALIEASKIEPLDVDGLSSEYGKIGFVVLSNKNGNLAFEKFKKYANTDEEINPRIIFVNGAQDGTDAYQWSTNPSILTKLRLASQESGLSNKQVQVAWIELSNLKPIGEFPNDANKIQKYLYNIVLKLKTDYPNLKIIYMSSDIYGGYATAGTVVEPYNYEGSFAIKWLIKDQISGNIELNYDPEKRVVKAPILLWGPYLWANGDNPRSDGLVWKRTDFGDDGVTLTDDGAVKFTQMLMDFFKNTDTTKSWFLKAE